MFKIISRKHYNQLLFLSNRSVTLQEEKEHLQDEKIKALLNLRIRRCVVGKKGCGKTTFIKNQIIPQLRGFFVVDLFDEYNTVAKEDKYVFDSNLPNNKNISNALTAIRNNLNKTIIVEDIGILALSGKYFIELISENNFLIVSQSYSNIMPVIEYIDYIHQIGDMFKDSPQSIEHKIIKHKYRT